MLKLIIEDDEGRKTVVPFVRDEITIGRQEGNTIRLTERNVSRHHARLVRQNGHILIEDLGSYNGTRINGEKIEAPSEIQDGDLVQIGDYDLALQSEAAAGASAPARAPARRPEPVEESDDAEEASGDGDEHDETPPPASAPRQHSTAVIRVDQVELNRSRKVQDVDVEKAPRLVVLTTEFKGQEFACIRTEMRIGRTDENDIALDHRSVSSTHAKVVREDTGEWRVIDMQSANGLTVNGEAYAQSALKHGDIVELGHVKLRFVGAGKPVGSLNVGSGRSKAPLAIGLVVVLAALGGGGFYFLKPRLFPATTPTTPDTQTPEDPKVVKAPEPVKPPPQEEVQKADPTPTPPVAPTPPAEDSSAKQLAEKLQGAREAMQARNFEQAMDILGSAKDASGALPAEAETLLDEARGEQLAKKGLVQALKDIEAGKLDEAGTALDAVVTNAQAKELSDARARLTAARAAAVKATPPPEAAPDKPRTTPRPSEVIDEQNRQALAEATPLIKSRQFQEAATLLEGCLKRDPANAECHLRLGSVFAGLGDMKKGAQHYRRFYELAPDHPSAAKVKQMVEGYEKQNKGQAANK